MPLSAGCRPGGLLSVFQAAEHRPVEYEVEDWSFGKAKGTKAAPVKEENDVSTEIADTFLLYTLKKKGKDGSLPREKLLLNLNRAAILKGDDLDDGEGVALRKYINDEDYLTDAANRGVIDFDATKAKQTVSVAE